MSIIKDDSKILPPIRSCKVKDLSLGILVDLEGDEFADPDHDNILYKSEYVEVLEIKRETDGCIIVSFDGGNIVFPFPHHEILLMETTLDPVP